MHENMNSTDRWHPSPPLMEQTLIDWERIYVYICQLKMKLIVNSEPESGSDGNKKTLM